MAELEIFESSSEVRRLTSLSKVINDEATLFKGALYDNSYVRGIKDTETLYLDDVVSKKIALPKLRRDLRKDVFDFFNAKLTDFINRKLAMFISDYMTDASGSLKQVIISIEDYTEDLDDLIMLGDEDPRVGVALRNIEVTYKSELADTKKLDIINQYYSGDGATLEEEVTMLVWLESSAAVMSDRAKIPVNARLEAGETMLLEKQKLITRIEDEKLPTDMDTIVLKGHQPYVISKLFNNKRTIKKINLKDLWI